MSRRAGWALVAGLFTHAFARMEFINPPPFGVSGDLSNSPTYDEGTTVNIAWTPGEKGGGVSLCLYQQNETDGMWFGDMEYLTQNALDITRYSWLVGTRKNLTVSNLFYLSIFQEGKGPSDSNSHYFYIAEKSTENTAPSSSSVVSSTPKSQTTSTAAPTLPPTSSSMQKVQTSTGLAGLPTSDATGVKTVPGQESSSDAFPLAVKIGLGIGIPIALVLGLAMGWLLFRHRKKRDTTPAYIMHEIPAGQNIQYKHYNNASYYCSGMNEAPLKSPVEMGQPYTQGSNGWAGAPPDKPEATSTATPIRYEM